MKSTLRAIEEEFVKLGNEVVKDGVPTEDFQKLADAIAKKIESLPSTSENTAFLINFLHEFNLLRDILKQPKVTIKQPDLKKEMEVLEKEIDFIQKNLTEESMVSLMKKWNDLYSCFVHSPPEMQETPAFTELVKQLAEAKKKIAAFQPPFNIKGSIGKI